MTITIEPERGGESENIQRMDLSLPISIDELRSLRAWLDDNGWHCECDDIDEFLSKEET